MKPLTKFAFSLAVFGLFVSPAQAKRHAKDRTVNDYIQELHLGATNSTDVFTSGSLFKDSSPFADLTSDYRARTVGDPLTIQVTESTSADSQGSTQTQRKVDTSTAITGLAGKVNTGGLDPILGAKSATNLQGTGQHQTSSTVRTVLTGQVVALLSNGQLVIEARRSILINNERQVLVLRGVVRNADISPSNAVTSTQIANLELELKGKGVISDATRPPNFILRTLLRLVSF